MPQLVAQLAILAPAPDPVAAAKAAEEAAALARTAALERLCSAQQNQEEQPSLLPNVCVYVHMRIV